MPNPLYNQYGGANNTNPMIQQIMNFRKSFNGNPQQMVQSLLNSGRISQAQMNKYVQQANEIYKLMK